MIINIYNSPNKSFQTLFRKGYGGVSKILRMKEKHTWSVQVLNELLTHDTDNMYDYEHAGESPLYLNDDDKKDFEETIKPGLEELSKYICDSSQLANKFYMNNATYINIC